MSKTLIKDELVFGADPEFFAACYGKDNQLAVIPPVVLRTEYGCEVEIEHHDPEGKHPVFKRYDEVKIHEDGAAFEMSVPPTNDWKELWNMIHDAKIQFGKDILDKQTVCNPVLYSIPTMNWQVERWINKGDEFRWATRFGCDEDYDVFNMDVPCREIDAHLHPERYAGGHIHVSGIPEIAKKPLQAIKSMVLTAGLAATAYSDVPELEKRRLFLYGKPGKFRPQNYPDGTVGIEYRTPSTRWTNSFELAEQVFTWATIGMKSLLQGNLLAELEGTIMEEAKKVIVSIDQVAAKQMLSYISSKV